MKDRDLRGYSDKLHLSTAELHSEHIALRYRRVIWSAAILTGLLQAWAYRNHVSPDGISYLDIARSCARGDWSSLVNGYWSPLYPFLLSLIFRFVKPSPYWESTVAHLVTFGIFILSLVCFEFFLSTLIRFQQQAESEGEREPLPKWALWCLGDSICVWFSLVLIKMERIQPDLCLAALTYLATAILVRIQAGEAGWGTSAIFGLVLAMAYFAKGFMFPLAFVYLVCGLLVIRPLPRAFTRMALAVVVFLLVSAPFIVALSNSKGRLTFGDTGRIAYAEFVDGVTRYIHWQGGPSGNGTPVHPTRLVIPSPALYEFTTPVGGTYPPWYDPSYWYEGVVPQFSLKNQLQAVRYTVQEYQEIFSYMGGIVVTFLCMAIFGQMSGPISKGLIEKWPVWAPPSAALVLYALVYVESRFVAGFLALIWMGLFSGLRFPRSQAAQVLIRCLTMATVITLSLGIICVAARSGYRALHPEPFINWEVAERLQEMGIQPGDNVASIGFSVGGFWAHLAGVKVIAEVPLGEVPTLWASPTQIQRKVLAAFSTIGAKVVVADREPPPDFVPGWQRIGKTDYFVYDLANVSGTRQLEKK